MQAKYSWPNNSEAQAKEAFKVLMSNRYKDFIYEVKDKYFIKHGGLKPTFFADDVWAMYMVYWNSPEAKAASERARKNKASGSGSGTKHTTGSINIAEHQARMVCVFIFVFKLVGFCGIKV